MKVNKAKRITDIDFERWRECPDCGEPVIGGKCNVITATDNLVRLDCSKCWNQQDIWDKIEED